MKFEPHTTRAITRIRDVILNNNAADIEEDAWQDCCEWIETADDHQIEQAICLCGEIRAGETEVTELWRRCFGDYTATPQYSLAFSRALMELVTLGSKQVEAA